VSKALRPILAAIVGVLLVPCSAAAQRPPDLSGHWVLASATALGAPATTATSGPEPASGSRARTRSTSSTTPTTKTIETDTRDERPITSNIVVGAPFNYGRECTLVLSGQTLTIDKAYLGSRTTPAPAITLQLDGRQTSAVDSYSPWAHIILTAQWIGAQLQITRPGDRSTTTQLVSIEGTRLVVVTSIEMSGQPTFKIRETFKYDKK